MKAKSILWYQFGNGAAIRDVAECRYSVVVGVILVLCTAIARNYDQTYWRETPMFLLGPLVFSFFSGSFLSLVYFKSIRPEAKEKMPWWRDYLSFMGLFWMTAPAAWLYALPAERLFEPMGAARMNITLLAVVSVWRVWLITRVLAVLSGGRFGPLLVRVLVVAVIEVFLVTFLGGAFAQKIAASMGGMRNAPDEDLIVGMVGTVFSGSVLSVPVLATALILTHDSLENLNGFIPPKSSRIPATILGAIMAFWLVAAIWPQAELKRNQEVETLVENGDYREAIEFLSRHSPEDFAPARRIPPDPYDYPVYKHLPGLIATLDGSEAEWVRELYIGYLETSFVHRFRTFEREQWATILGTLDRLPGGPLWIEEHSKDLAEKLRLSRSGNQTNESAMPNLEALKEKYGILEEEK